METLFSLNSILNTPWIIAILPSILTSLVTVIRRINSPLKEEVSFYEQCNIRPWQLRMSLTRYKLHKASRLQKVDLFFYILLILILTFSTGSFAWLTARMYDENPKGWALLKLTSTNEYFLISPNEAKSPDRVSWQLTPGICLAQTYDAIAKERGISHALTFQLCRAITLPGEEPKINAWIIKVHKGIFKITMFTVPLLLLMTWFNLALLLDVRLKIKINKYNQRQQQRAAQYLT